MIFVSWDHMFTIAYANDIDWSAWSSGPRQHSMRGLPGGDVTKIIASLRRMRGNDLRYILQYLKDVYFSLNFFLVIFLDTFCITMNGWFYSTASMQIAKTAEAAVLLGEGTQGDIPPSDPFWPSVIPFVDSTAPLLDASPQVGPPLALGSLDQCCWLVRNAFCWFPGIFSHHLPSSSGVPATDMLATTFLVSAPENVKWRNHMPAPQVWSNSWIVACYLLGMLW